MREAGRFFRWCETRNLTLGAITPFAVATYIEEMQDRYTLPTVKQHLSALRALLDYLVVGQVLPANPAAPVRGPKHIVKQGKTPALSAGEARTLLDSIDLEKPAGLRDRALLATMVYSFARVGAMVGMNVEDYYRQGKAGGCASTKRAASPTRSPPPTMPRSIWMPTSRWLGSAMRRVPLCGAR